MFLTLLLATFVIAALISFLVIALFKRPIGRILSRIIADEISDTWVTYITFGLYVVGISSGVRINQLERYITRPPVEDAQVVSLTFERGVLEVYRTIISALQGLAAALLVFFIVALIAFVVVRIVELTRGRASDAARR
jgi:large-conductance mechanosensitive channel